MYRILRKLLLAAFCMLPPAAVLAVEFSDKEAEEIEQLLATLKFDPGPVDGVVDARTRTAIGRRRRTTMPRLVAHASSRAGESLTRFSPFSGTWFPRAEIAVCGAIRRIAGLLDLTRFRG